MYKPPFLRRVLPWMYALVFVVVAPMLLFYTAGYRYNLKKRLVERSGALIVDGAPKDAKIFLDGIDTNKTLPYTFQHITQGWHTLHLEKSGYSTWDKQLEVRAEQVTFANNIRLWATQTAKLVLSKTIAQLEADPTDNVFAVLERHDARQRLAIWNPRTENYQTSNALPSTPSSSPRLPIRWNSEGTSFVFNGINLDQPSYWSTTEATPHTDQLPTAIYTWSTPYTLIGSDDQFMIRLQTRSNRFARDRLPDRFIFRDGDLNMQTTTTTPASLLLTKNGLEDRLYQLINPNFRLVERRNNLLILEDPFSHNWLALDLSRPHPYAGDVRGDYPRWSPKTDKATRERALVVHAGELWLWEPNERLTLLWRQAEPLRQAMWDSRGTHVILADATRVFALELDDRDGRITTPLSDLDDIQDIGILGKTLYISGTKNDRQGIFSLSLE